MVEAKNINVKRMDAGFGLTQTTPTSYTVYCCGGATGMGTMIIG